MHRVTSDGCTCCVPGVSGETQERIGTRPFNLLSPSSCVSRVTRISSLVSSCGSEEDSLLFLLPLASLTFPSFLVSCNSKRRNRVWQPLPEKQGRGKGMRGESMLHEDSELHCTAPAYVSCLFIDERERACVTLSCHADPCYRITSQARPLVLYLS